MTAGKNTLNELHEVVATGLKTVLENGVVKMDKEGNEVTETAPAAYFAAAIAMLKNNNITAPEDNDALKALREKLAEKRKKQKAKSTAGVMDDAFEQLERDLGGHVSVL